MLDAALTSHRKGQRRIPLFTCNLGPNAGKDVFPFIFFKEQYVSASSFGILTCAALQGLCVRGGGAEMGLVDLLLYE